MASYRGHLTFAGLLGAGYGSLALLEGNGDWGPALIAAGLTTLGGLLPDLDSDSGVPVRELFGAAAAVVPILLFDRVKDLCQQSTEQTLFVLRFFTSLSATFCRIFSKVLPSIAACFT